MDISSKTIIKKMHVLLEEAEAAQTEKEMVDYISKIKLLSEILLDEQQENKTIVEKTTHVTETPTKVVPSTHVNDDDDGTSIFDF